jgi:hypothetical protein
MQQVNFLAFLIVWGRQQFSPVKNNLSWLFATAFIGKKSSISIITI